MELDIIVVGAGLAGLAAANGLRRAGHRVRIFERSRFANEIGAGITITANATLVLRKWGFNFESARVVDTRAIRVCNGETLEELSCTVVNDETPDMFNVYRPDYHAELWNMAVTEDGEGFPARIILGAEVLKADAETGTISLADGTSHSADLIIGADGVHSKIREVIVPNEVSIKHSGQNAYRCISTAQSLEADPITKALWETKKSKWTIYTLRGRDYGFAWYDMRRGELQNLVLMYPSENQSLSSKGKTQRELKESLMYHAKGFHPDLQRVISTAQDIKPWELVLHGPLRTWIKGRLLLVGDAAHPVHPLNGQGVNTAVEDAAALQILLRNVQDRADLQQRTKIFETIRLPRTAIMQIYAPVPPGQESMATHRAEPYFKGGTPIKTSADRSRYDAFAAAEEALAGLPAITNEK